MSSHLDRALILFQQSRHDLAEQELRQELAQDPENPPAHALLALCLADQERFDEATREAESAVHQGPDQPFTHCLGPGVRSPRPPGRSPQRGP